jgi:hypothetical protein
LYLFVCVLAFGVFIPFLGFFWDDWPTIFYTHSGRIAQLITHFSYDRPFSVWGYWLIGRLGTSPITWQVAGLLIRWGIIVSFAWALKPLWPQHTKKIIAIALLFAIYPGYYLQPSSVIFSSHLLAYLFFLISLGAMGRAFTEPKNARVYSLIAIGSTIVHMFTLEYFVGLELTRPIYLWFLLGNTKQAYRQRIKKVFNRWLPYLGVAVAWLLWRLFLLKLPIEPYPLVIAQAIKSDPINGLAQFLTMAVQDTVYVLGSTWSQIIDPRLFRLEQVIDVFAWGVAAITFAVIYFALNLLDKEPKKPSSLSSNEAAFARQAFLLGSVALVGGLAPVWMIGERIAQGDYNLRYILVGMFGAALIVGGLIYGLIREERQRIVIVSLLVALTIGMHARAANDYRLDWEAQRAFYWQLYWRAPDIEPYTALISFDRVSTYLGDPMTGNALNVLYPLSSQPPHVEIWNFELNRTETVRLIEGEELLQEDYRGLTFNTKSPDDLVFYFLPEDGCLWTLNSGDVNNEYLPFENRELVSKSNLANILAAPENNSYPDPVVFGNEPEHDWCFYFEKADLARQQGDWEAVISLMDEANNRGLAPNIGVEWLPLVEAYSQTGDWRSALTLSEEIHAMHSRNDSMLCSTWGSMAKKGLSIPAEIKRQMFTMAGCRE